MKALFKTLFGDVHNLGVVGLVVLIELLLVYFGLAREAGFAMPVVILAGVAWLATK